MEIERKGANCVVITSKKNSFVTDPKLSLNGLKDQARGAGAVLLTQTRFMTSVDEGIVVIDGPGEYEVQNCSIKGIPAIVHTDVSDGPQNATIYRLELEDCSICIIGHIKPKLDEAAIEAIGVVDILIVPVGGYGYTLEPKEAVNLVKTIEPKVVIPMHYAEEGVAYDVPQAPLEEFVKDLGGAHEQLPKLKIKNGAFPEALTVYELKRVN